MLYSYDRMKKKVEPALRELGSLIRSERKRRDLTQTELGQLSATSINFVSQVEAGKATAQIGKVLRVLQILGYEMHCLRGPKGLVVTDAND
jgi:HTH-type transcriptional regulator/antitoxin HipB